MSFLNIASGIGGFMAGYNSGYENMIKRQLFQQQQQSQDLVGQYLLDKGMPGQGAPQMPGVQPGAQQGAQPPMPGQSSQPAGPPQQPQPDPGAAAYTPALQPRVGPTPTPGPQPGMPRTVGVGGAVPPPPGKPGIETGMGEEPVTPGLAPTATAAPGAATPGPSPAGTDTSGAPVSHLSPEAINSLIGNTVDWKEVATAMKAARPNAHPAAIAQAIETLQKMSASNNKMAQVSAVGALKYLGFLDKEDIQKWMESNRNTRFYAGQKGQDTRLQQRLSQQASQFAQRHQQALTIADRTAKLRALTALLSEVQKQMTPYGGTPMKPSDPEYVDLAQERDNLKEEIQQLLQGQQQPQAQPTQ